MVIQFIIYLCLNKNLCQIIDSMVKWLIIRCLFSKLMPVMCISGCEGVEIFPIFS
jgi:hypothetical protein